MLHRVNKRSHYVFFVFCQKVVFIHKRGSPTLSPWWCHHGNVDSVSSGNRKSQWYMTNTAVAHRPGGVGVSPCSFCQSRCQSSNIPLTTKYPEKQNKKNIWSLNIIVDANIITKCWDQQDTIEQSTEQIVIRLTCLALWKTHSGLKTPCFW